MRFDVTALLSLSTEGRLAVPSLRSVRSLVAHASANGLAVEVCALLDAASEETVEVVEEQLDLFQSVVEVNCRDLGPARNVGIEAARGDYVALLDGDDLWGNNWLSSATHAARTSVRQSSIWHPRWVLYFDPEDQERRYGSARAHEAFGSHFLRLTSSDDSSFDRNALLLDNLWTSNSFAEKSTYLSHPFPEVDRSKGLGIEDWSWNIATLSHGIHHRVISDTVHLVRVKPTSSLGARNADQRLLPRFPESFLRRSLVTPAEIGFGVVPGDESSASLPSEMRSSCQYW